MAEASKPTPNQTSAGPSRLMRAVSVSCSIVMEALEGGRAGRRHKYMGHKNLCAKLDSAVQGHGAGVATGSGGGGGVEDGGEGVTVLMIDMMMVVMMMMMMVIMMMMIMMVKKFLS